MISDTHRVLLVVDVQNDFCPGGNLAVPEGDRVVEVINTLMSRFYAVAATQDWHPEGHVSFASSHTGKKAFDVIELGGRRQVLWPDHCVVGSSGAEFHPDLNTDPFRAVFRKGSDPNLDSYSAFFENDRKTPTGVEDYLKGIGLTEVYLTGLAMDVCVYFSAMDAVHSGFKTYLVEDACRGIDSPAGSLTERIDGMKAAGVRIVRSGDIA
jgi:nicotinamidase/pyrazinamidase